MKKKKLCLLFGISLIIGLLSGCSNSEENTQDKITKSENSTTISNTDGLPSEQGQATTNSDVELSNTYTTRFGEINQITAPVFTFSYPAGWNVESEEVTPISEEVVLPNDAGVTVTYWNFSGMRELTGPTRDINEVDIKRVADASFVPGYVQNTDYSDLGKFMVAEIETTGRYDVLGGGDYIEVDDESTRYALLPESQVGEQQECIIPGLPTFSFWYAGHISMIVQTSNEDFTDQEKSEVIAILSSFQDTAVSDSPEDTPANSEDTDIIKTIDELWKVLDRTWTFEEYKYNGHALSETAHTIEFRYVDNEPCMSWHYQIEPPVTRDRFFCEFEPVDKFHYNAYIYRRGIDDPKEGNWSDDIKNAWWSYDITNLSEGILNVWYYVASDTSITTHQFTYTSN